MLKNNKNKGMDLNIISKTNTHGGFGAGMINLSNMSAVIIDGEEAYIDIGALHAKSKIERGIKFLPQKDEVPNGRKCWIVWAAADRNENGPYYAGLTACEMLVDPEARRGWKILADHVNKMDAAMKRRYMLDELNDQEKATLRHMLEQHNVEMWANSPEELKNALT
ncbi:hypothetical protein BEP19_12380 [Ammoniphilus oxalaticus]|uniref:YwhD family protein n=1 Tax=Ammoniphilus oxalaticus TaxID=66863 RepID=A0A419SGX0_9BACL|nr:YwhD family protein [Ammoniphilus oxalaticus]RKD23020.1 hypothetical protein BEP19_12380 [Ammoniphilus oxalaticus]